MDIFHTIKIFMVTECNNQLAKVQNSLQSKPILKFVSDNVAISYVSLL